MNAWRWAGRFALGAVLVCAGQLLPAFFTGTPALAQTFEVRASAVESETFESNNRSNVIQFRITFLWNQTWPGDDPGDTIEADWRIRQTGAVGEATGTTVQDDKEGNDFFCDQLEGEVILEFPFERAEGRNDWKSRSADIMCSTESFNDDLFEHNEDIVLEITEVRCDACVRSADTNVSVSPSIAARTATITLRDNDFSPGVNISIPAGAAEVEEGATPAVLTVQLDRFLRPQDHEVSGVAMPDQPVIDTSVILEISGTAEARTGSSGGDYIIPQLDANNRLTVTFAPDESQKTISFQIIDDSLSEGSEQITVTIVDTVLMFLQSNVADRRVTGTILDNDIIGVSIGSASSREGDAGDSNTLVFSVRLGSISPAQVTVPFSISRDSTASTDDYTLETASPLVFEPGDLIVGITVTIVGDDAQELHETVVVELSTPSCPGCDRNFPPTLLDGASVGEGIIRDDDAALLSIDSVAAVPEGNAGDFPASMVFTVTLDATIPSLQHAQPVTVNYTVEGSAEPLGRTAVAEDDDHNSPETGSLTFNVGVFSQSITIQIIPDDIYELDETISISLSESEQSILWNGVPGRGVVENDDSLPEFTISGETVAEGDSGSFEMVFTVQKTGLTSLASLVKYRLDAVNSTATVGVDYESLPEGEFVFAATERRRSILVTILGDNLAEVDETVVLALFDPDTAVVPSSPDRQRGTGTIRNDDPHTVSIGSTSVDEGNLGAPRPSLLTFEVTLASQFPGDVTVDFTVEGGTAEVDSDDYDLVTIGPLIFTAGQTLHTIQIIINADNDSEEDEPVVVTLSAPTCAACPEGVTPLIGVGMGTGIIINDDVTLLSISSPLPVTEGDRRSGSPFITFTVTLVPPVLDKSVTVNYAVSGTATAGDDYSRLSGSVLFEAGDAEETISVRVFGDETYEEDETIVITLIGISDARLRTAVGTGTIINDDAPPLITISAPDSIDEGDFGTVVLEITISKSDQPTEEVAAVDFELSGTASISENDYSTTAISPITFSPTETEPKIITILINGDQQGEGDETVTVTLSNPRHAEFPQRNTLISATTFIVDDDGILVSINSPEVDEGNSGRASLSFVVTLALAPVEEVTIQYSVSDGTATLADADYEALPDGVLRFVPGDRAELVTVNVIGDTKNEYHETVTVTLTNPTGDASFPRGQSTLSNTGTILSDDLPLISIAEASVAEGQSGVTELAFTVRASHILDREVTVGYSVAGGTATVGEDYRRIDPGRLSFAALSSNLEQTITVAVLGDAIPEGDESLAIELSDPTNAVLDGNASLATGTILTDDRRIGISSESRVLEGAQGAELLFKITLDPALDPVADTVTELAVGYAITTGSTAKLGADFERPVPAGPLLFGANQSAKFVSVKVNDDFIEETLEWVEIMLVPAGDATAIEGTSYTGAMARGEILPRPSDYRLSVTSGRIEAGVPGEESTLDLTFQMDPPPPDGYEAEIEYRVLLPDGRAAGAPGPGLSNREEFIADESGQMTITHSLGATIDLDIASDLFVVLGQVLVDGVPDRNVNVAPGMVIQGVSPDLIADRLGFVLSGTGRSLATGLVDNLWERANAHRPNGGASLAVVGGRSLNTEAFTPDGSPAQAAREVAGLFGIQSVAPSTAPAADLVQSADGDFDAYRKWAGLPESADLARKSRFSLSFGGSKVGSVTTWGKADFRDSEGTLNNGEFYSKNETTGWVVGIDYRVSNSLVLGLASSQVTGDTSYVLEEGKGGGNVDTSLITYVPWLHLTSTKGFEFWGAFGFGSGTSGIEDSGFYLDTDVSLTVFAAGLRGWESRVGSSRIAVKADAFTASLSADSADDDFELEDADGSSSRLRLAIETSSTRDIGGGQLAAGLDIGARFDGGDAETGTGTDITTEFRFISPQGRLEVSGRSGFILFHGNEGFRETAFGLGIAYKAGLAGRGFQMSLEPALNRAALDGESLWDSHSIDSVDSPSRSGAAYRARIGYGLDTLRGRALATAYGETIRGDGDARLRVGTELTELASSVGRIRMAIYGQRKEEDGSAPDNSLTLEGGLGF